MQYQASQHHSINYLLEYIIIYNKEILFWCLIVSIHCDLYMGDGTINMIKKNVIFTENGVSYDRNLFYNLNKYYTTLFGRILYGQTLKSILPGWSDLPKHYSVARDLHNVLQIRFQADRVSRNTVYRCCNTGRRGTCLPKTARMIQTYMQIHFTRMVVCWILLGLYSSTIVVISGVNDPIEETEKTI